jgi:hypothetical protein
VRMGDRPGIRTMSIYFDIRIGVIRVEIRVETVKEFKYPKKNQNSFKKNSKFLSEILRDL